jgi:hypothetical protein
VPNLKKPLTYPVISHIEVQYVAGSLPQGEFVGGLPSDGSTISAPAVLAQAWIAAGIAKPASAALRLKTTRRPNNASRIRRQRPVQQTRRLQGDDAWNHPDADLGGRKMLVTPTGVISDGVTIELGAERSVALRNPLIGSTGTIVSIEPTLSATVPAVSVGELPIWLSMTKTDTVSGTAAPYEWDYDYSMTAANSPTSYSLVATDGFSSTLRTTASLSQSRLRQTATDSRT